MVHVTLQDWLGLGDDPFVKRYGLPRLVLEAVVKEVDAVVREINQKNADREAKQQMEAMNLTSGLNFGKQNSSMTRLFG